VNLVTRNVRLQLANQNLQLRYRIAIALICFGRLSNFPAEVIQLLVTLRDDAFGVIKRTLQLRRMFPCMTEFLRTLPLLISQCFDLSGSHTRRSQERVMR